MTARTRLRRAVPVLAAVLALTVAGGCSTSIAGSGGQAGSRGAGDVRTANQLAALLMDVPAGATEGADAFHTDHTPSLDEFARGYYGGSSDATPLRRLGVTEVAHEGWTTGDGNAAEIVLWLFVDDRAATTWMTGETAALRDAGALSAPLDAVPAVTGYMFTQYAGGGAQNRRYYATDGRVGMTFNYFTPPHSGPGQAPAWVGTQYGRLA